MPTNPLDQIWQAIYPGERWSHTGEVVNHVRALAAEHRRMERFVLGLSYEGIISDDAAAAILHRTPATIATLKRMYFEPRSLRIILRSKL